jgi:hypothetical protein
MIRMTGKEIYEQVLAEMFKTGSCPIKQWIPIKVTNGEVTIDAEGFNPSRGNIRVRVHVKGDKYKLFKFNNKKELIYEGIFEFEF